jgi:hypothetical protein
LGRRFCRRDACADANGGDRRRRATAICVES